MDVTTMSPPEVDTELARLYEEQLSALRYVYWALDALHESVKDKKVDQWGKISRWGGKGSRWQMTEAEVMAALPTEGYEAVYSIPRSLEKLTESRAKIAEIRTEIHRYNDEFHRRGGWSRFFMVPGGHIHSSMECSTCYPTTMFGWLPDLSGLTEADAVAAHGSTLCTICYPTAPVEWTSQKLSKKGQLL